LVGRKKKKKKEAKKETEDKKKGATLKKNASGKFIKKSGKRGKRHQQGKGASSGIPREESSIRHNHWVRSQRNPKRRGELEASLKREEIGSNFECS